jgi:hypothetical protein
MAIWQVSIGCSSLTVPVFSVEPTSLGEAVAAVVLDDVDDRQVAPHQVHELPDADGAGVAVAADADGDQLAVGDHRAGADRRHAPVHGVEAVRGAEEIRRALARAADARQLEHLRRIHAHLEEGVDDALGDGVVPAPGAQRRLAAAVRLHFQADAIQLLVHDCYSPAVMAAEATGLPTSSRAFSPSCTRISSVTERASMGRPV